MAPHPTITGLSLCSGVGMLDEGVRAAWEWFGHRYWTVCACEISAYASATLLARMEEETLEQAFIWDDLATLDGGPWRGVVDCIVAGFPCQPWSSTGERRGVEDKRWLWPAIARIIEMVRPRFVFLENVPGLITWDGLSRVLSSLAELGFDAEWGSLTAAAVGANHKRRRVFILAYRAGTGLWEREPAQTTHHKWSESIDIREAMADADQRGAYIEATSRRDGAGAAVAATGPAMVDAAGQRESATQFWPERITDPTSMFAPGPDDLEWEQVVQEQPHLLPAVEPGVRVLADGLAMVVDKERVDQLRCAGNGVVPLAAAAAFVELMRRACGSSTATPTETPDP